MSINPAPMADAHFIPDIGTPYLRTISEPNDLHQRLREVTIYQRQERRETVGIGQYSDNRIEEPKAEGRPPVPPTSPPPPAIDPASRHPIGSAPV